MNWNLALSVFVGTLPIFGAIVWNLLKLDRLETRIDKHLDAIYSELKEIRLELARHGERLATLEERDRLTHQVVQP